MNILRKAEQGSWILKEIQFTVYECDIRPMWQFTNIRKNDTDINMLII